MLFNCITIFTVSLHLVQGLSQTEDVSNRTFDIDYENNVFLKDGEPFTYAAGEMHYFRIPRQYWKDRLRKLRLAGLNAIQTYVEWSLHEPSPGVYDFQGQADIAEFIKIAQKEGLLVILRPGPYICAERDFGGYPAWLLTVNPDMRFRTSDPSHTFFINRWFGRLMGQIQPLLYGKGGPIIMIQVENEYGSYTLNDKNYLLWLRDLFRSYVGNAAVLFTTDGFSYGYVSRGKIPGVFATVDFGTTGNALQNFADLRKIQPRGPLVNSEFYVGWITYWGDKKFSTVETDKIVDTIKDMISNNISFSCYMFHGGTNFAFTSGSGSDSGKFIADLTSYDYDAPISEAGDLTDKYMAIKEALKEKYPSEPIDEKERFKPKGNYGTVKLSPVVSLLNSKIGKEPVYSKFPKPMEAIAQRYGFISYTTTIRTDPKDPSVLQVTVRDRALVLLDGIEVSTLQYTVINETPLPSNTTIGQNITILVENMGRRNYQYLKDCSKGMVSNATLDGNLLLDWTIVGYPLTSDNVSQIYRQWKKKGSAEGNAEVTLPAFYVGSFQLKENEDPLDSYLDMSEWGKGIVFVNNHNLGRYWHIGPQKTLYVPGIYFRQYPAMNIVTVMELHYTHPSLTVEFKADPILNGGNAESAAKVEPEVAKVDDAQSSLANNVDDLPTDETKGTDAEITQPTT